MKKIVISMFFMLVIVLSSCKVSAKGYDLRIITGNDEVILDATTEDKVEFRRGDSVDNSDYDKNWWVLYCNGREIYQSNETLEYKFIVNQTIVVKDNFGYANIEVAKGETLSFINGTATDIAQYNETWWLFKKNDKLTYASNNTVNYIISFKQRPAISGKDTIINNISSPYTQSQIQRISQLSAYDEYDGDISDKIILVRDEYADNKNKIGVFEQEYRVTNSAGLSSSYILLIANYDFNPPVIEGEDETTISYKDNFDVSSILNKYTVSDNNDSNIELIIENNDNYVKNKVGTFVFSLSATDSSGNKATTTHTLRVIDDVVPVFKDQNEGKIQINFKTQINDELLLSGLTAHDEIDGDLTNKITIVKNDLTNKLGTYTVMYEVEDTSGNKSVHERNYEVITTDAPTFSVSYTLIAIEDVNTMTIEQLINIIISYENIELSNYEIIENEYSGNENQAGEYKIKLRVTNGQGESSDIERIVKVFSQKDETGQLNFTRILKEYWFVGIIMIAALGLSIYYIKKKIK